MWAHVGELQRLEPLLGSYSNLELWNGGFLDSIMVSFCSVVLPGFPFCVFFRLLLPVCRAAVWRLASSPSPESKVVRPVVCPDRQDGRPDVSLCCPYLKHCGYTCIQHAALLSFLLGPGPNRTACVIDNLLIGCQVSYNGYWYFLCA